MAAHTFQQISPHVYWLSPDHTTDLPFSLGANDQWWRRFGKPG